MYVLGDPVALVDPTGMDVEGGDDKDGGGDAWETLDAENVNYNTKTVTITAKAPHNSRVWDAASGFAQRATEIAMPLYGAAVGLYEFFAKTEQAFNSASRIVQGEGQTQDFLSTFAGVSFADEALGMYTFGQGLVNGDQGAYQQVGRMAFDAALSGGVGLVSGGGVVTGGETVFRSMSIESAEAFLRTRRMPAGTETFISPTKSFAQNYTGTLFEINLKPGTLSQLEAIGVRNASSGHPFGHLPLVGKGWKGTNAFFKVEGHQVNIGLGNGRALSIFNSSIQSFNKIE